MRIHTHIHVYLSAGLVAFCCLAAAGCSQQPELDKNSPEYLFSQVKDAIRESRYEKAIGWTSDLQDRFPSSEQAKKARILRIILLAGLSDGYRNIAAAYLLGSEQSSGEFGKLRSTAFNYHRRRKSVALALYQACDGLLKTHSPQSTYTLELSLPEQSSTQSSNQLDEVRDGKPIDSEQQREAEATELPLGVARTLARFLGGEEEHTLVEKTLEQGSVNLVPGQLLVMVAQSLLDNQRLFGREGLSEVKNYYLFLRKASESLELALASLQDRPDEEIQAKADQLKAEIEAMTGKTTSSSG